MARILVADDSEELRETMIAYLGRGGHEVTVASDGREALKLLTGGNKFDLVISDYDMPHMTGLELLKKVKANPDLAKIPFVILSGTRGIDEAVQTMGGVLWSKMGTIDIRKEVKAILAQHSTT